MRILFDHQAFTEQRFGGVSRYFVELIGRLGQDPSVDCFLSVRFSNNEHLLSAGNLRVSRFLGQKRFKGQFSLLKFINRHYSIKNLNRRDFDLFHPTYFDPYFLKYLKGRPYVLTVFDMISEHFGAKNSAVGGITPNKKTVISGAAQLIAISQSTKDDLLRFTSISEDKVSVVPLASPLSKAFAQQIAKENQPLVPRPYLLFVGLRGLYKNFDVFLEAASPLLKQNNLALVCAGGGAFVPREKALIEKLELAGLVRQMRINDQKLAWLYKNALAFVFPSLYEGFGLPILEAFACGCPVVLSDNSSLPEVAGEAGIYFDPLDGGAIRLALEAVISDPGLRQAKVKKGYEQLLKFSWDKTVDMTKAVYQKALAEIS